MDARGMARAVVAIERERPAEAGIARVEAIAGEVDDPDARALCCERQSTPVAPTPLPRCFTAPRCQRWSVPPH